jgi:hypothetical protein
MITKLIFKFIKILFFVFVAFSINNFVNSISILGIRNLCSDTIRLDVKLFKVQESKYNLAEVLLNQSWFIYSSNKSINDIDNEFCAFNRILSIYPTKLFEYVFCITPLQSFLHIKASLCINCNHQVKEWIIFSYKYSKYSSHSFYINSEQEKNMFLGCIEVNRNNNLYKMQFKTLIYNDSCVEYLLEISQNDIGEIQIKPFVLNACSP